MMPILTVFPLLLKVRISFFGRFIFLKYLLAHHFNHFRLAAGAGAFRQYLNLTVVPFATAYQS